MAKAHPRIEVRMSTEFVSFEQNGGGVAAQVKNAAGETETIRGSYLVSCEGARSVARRMLDVEFEGFTYPERTINIEVAYDFRKHGYTERNYISDPDEYSNLFHWKGPPDRWRIHFPTAIDDDENELKRPEALQARLSASSASTAISRFAGATSTRCTSGWRRSSARAACCSPATPPTSTARSAEWG